MKLLFILAALEIAFGSKKNRKRDTGIAMGIFGILGVLGASRNGRTRGGRRRSSQAEDHPDFDADIVALANDEMCWEISEHFFNEHFIEFMSTLSHDGGNGAGLEHLADLVSEWCTQEAVAQSRRLEMSDFSGSNEDQWISYIESLDQERFFRRSEGLGPDVEDTHLPPTMFMQCEGYATALGMLIANEGSELGAVMFGASAHGSFHERSEGCGNIVRSVNAALENGAIEGLELVDSELVESEEDDEGQIVVVSSELAEHFGAMLTAVTLASGLVVHKLMDICNYY